MFWRAIAVLVLVFEAFALLVVSPRPSFNTAPSFGPNNAPPIVSDTNMAALHREAKSAMNALLGTHSQRLQDRN
jgi:hypothetical protein